MLFDIYQWRQRLYDGSYTTFERAKSNGAAFALPVVGNKIVLARIIEPGINQVFMLGGRLEDGESPRKGAMRELLEEAGLYSDDVELLHMYDTNPRIKHRVYLFVARNCIKKAEPHLDPGEKIRAVPMDFGQLIKTGKKFNGEFGRYFYMVSEDKRKLKSFRRKLFGSSSV